MFPKLVLIKSVGNKFIKLFPSLKGAIAISVAKTCHR